MAINTSALMKDYHSGMSIKQLAAKYKMGEQELNAAIDKELHAVTDYNQIRQQQLAEHNQKVGEQYNLAYQKLQSGEYKEALKLGLSATIDFFNPPQDPNLITGVAPCPMKWADIKSLFSLIKSLKNLPQVLSNLKNCKTVQQFKDFIIKIAKQLGIGKKLNPNSFGPKVQRPSKIYTITTHEGAKVSQSYGKSGVIYYDTKIPNGFRSGDRAAIVGNDGKVTNASREIITIDRELDQYLLNAINYAKNATKNMNEVQKIKFIYKMIQEISGNAYKGLSNSEKLAKAYKGKEVLLGDVFANGAACCRHKSLMFKIIADEVGLNAKAIRGEMGTINDLGGHCWNEVKLSNGKKFVVDTQSGALINLSSPTKAEQEWLKKYYYNKESVYY